MPTANDYWNAIDMGKVSEIMGMRRKQTAEEYYREQLAKAQGIPTYEESRYQPQTQAQRDFAERCALADKRQAEDAARLEQMRSRYWASVK